MLSYADDEVRAGTDEIARTRPLMALSYVADEAVAADYQGGSLFCGFVISPAAPPPRVRRVIGTAMPYGIVR